MKAKKHFLPAISALLLLTFVQSASAHMLLTYETAVMQWVGERSSMQDGTPLYLDLYSGETFQFEISFVIPDIDFDSMGELEVIERRFNNAATNIRSSGFFEKNAIENSTLWFLVYKYEEHIYAEWELIVNFANNNLPNGTTARAYIYSVGDTDSMGLIVDNLHYSRSGFDAIIDIEAGFNGDYQGEYPNDLPGLPRFSVKHISVPEPLTPALLLTGLLGIFAARKIKSKTLSSK